MYLLCCGIPAQPYSRNCCRFARQYGHGDVLAGVAARLDLSGLSLGLEHGQVPAPGAAHGAAPFGLPTGEETGGCGGCFGHGLSWGTGKPSSGGEPTLFPGGGVEWQGSPGYETPSGSLSGPPVHICNSSKKMNVSMHCSHDTQMGIWYLLNSS